MFYPSGHGNCLTCCSISPNGQFAISGGGDGTVRIWNLKSGREIGLLCANREAVTVVKYSPEGDRVLTGDAFGTVRIWDPETETNFATLAQLDAQVTCAVFSSNGDEILVGYGNGIALRWNIATSALIRSYELGEWDEDVFCDDAPGEYRSSVVSCDLSPDGNLLLAISEVDAQTIGRVVNVHTGEVQQSYWCESNDLCGAAFTRDSKGVLIRDLSGSIQVMNIATWAVVSDYVCRHSFSFSPLYYGLSPCRRRIVYGNVGRGYPEIIDASSNERLPPLQDPMTQLGYVDSDPSLAKELISAKGCAIPSDGNRILAMSHSDHRPGLRLWDIETSAVITRMEWDMASLSKIAISPDGSMFCALARDMSVMLYRLDFDASPLHLIKSHLILREADELYQCGFSPNGKTFFVTTGHEIWVWNRDGKLLKKVTGWTNPAFHFGLAASADLTHFIGNDRLVTVDHSQGTRLYDLGKDASPISIVHPVGSLTPSESAPDNDNCDEDDEIQPEVVIRWRPNLNREKAVFLTSYGVVKRMDLSSQQIEAIYNASDIGVKDVDSTSDGTHVVCLTNSGELQLLDGISLTIVRKISDDQRANMILLSPCGQRLLVCQSNGGIYVEELFGSPSSARRPKSYGVADAAWHPSGQWILSVGRDGVIRTWAFSPNDPELTCGPTLSYLSGREGDQSNWASWTGDGRWTGSGPILLQLIRSDRPSSDLPRRTAAEMIHTMGRSSR